MLESFQPIIVFQGRTQMAGWRNDEALPLRVIGPGIRQEFLSDAPSAPAPQPTAVVTTHPSHGLDWLLDRWSGQIHPAVPQAKLVVVSTILAKGKAGADVPDETKALLAKTVASAEDNVEIVAPQGDYGMAELYRSARVHLYPGHADDMVCWTLMESQACGLPAVARPLGAVHERLCDGQTGSIVPDDAAFANVAIRLLSNDDSYWSMNREARLSQRQRTWDVAAAEFETLVEATGE